MSTFWPGQRSLCPSLAALPPTCRWYMDGQTDQVLNDRHLVLILRGNMRQCLTTRAVHRLSPAKTRKMMLMMTAQTLFNLLLLVLCALSAGDASESTLNADVASRASDVRHNGQRTDRAPKQAEEFVRAAPSERDNDDSAVHVTGDRDSDAGEGGRGGGQRGCGLRRYLRGVDRSERKNCDGNADTCRGHIIPTSRDSAPHLQSARNR